VDRAHLMHPREHNIGRPMLLGAAVAQQSLLEFMFRSEKGSALFTLPLSLIPVRGRVTAPIDSRKDHMRRGSVELM